VELKRVSKLFLNFCPLGRAPTRTTRRRDQKSWRVIRRKWFPIIWSSDSCGVVPTNCCGSSGADGFIYFLDLNTRFHTPSLPLVIGRYARLFEA